MELDDKALDVLKPAIEATWSYIGQDCDDFVSDNFDCLEACIDANRLRLCGNSPEADELISELIIEHGYDEVMDFLNDHINIY